MFLHFYFTCIPGLIAYMISRVVSPGPALPLTLRDNAYTHIRSSMGEKMVFRRYRFFIPYPFYLYCVILCIYLVLCLLLQITGLGLSPSRARSYILRV